jgi:putative transposase
MVKDLPELDLYPWSGHAVLMGSRQMEGQELPEILLRYGKNVNIARTAYREFIADGIKTGHRADLVGGGLKRSMARMDSDEKEWGNFDERVLGSGDFVDSLQQNETLRDRLPVSMALPELIRRVSAVFNLQPEAIIRHGKARPISEARGIVAYFAVFELGLKGVEVGKAIRLTSSGVSKAIQRGERLVREKPELNEIFQKLVT